MKSYVVLNSTKVKGQRKVEGAIVDLTEAEAEDLLKEELIKEAPPPAKAEAAKTGKK